MAHKHLFGCFPSLSLGDEQFTTQLSAVRILIFFLTKHYIAWIKRYHFSICGFSG